LLLEYKAEMNRHEAQFHLLVDAFLAKYDVLVAAAAFKLGALFDRDEYLPRDQVAKRFRFEIDFSPLPTAGDFRLDIESEVQRELVEQYERRMTAQVAAAQQDAWRRTYEALARMKDRLTLNEDGTRRTFHDTTVSNLVDLCAALTSLNVTNDPALEKARQQLEDAITGVTPAGLRKEEGERLVVLHKVSTLLDSFDWGVDDEA
jgi:hypothetical protein